MEKSVSGTGRMGRIPKDQRASLHVSKSTNERVKRCLSLLIGKRGDSSLTADDVVNEMADCFENSRKK